MTQFVSGWMRLPEDSALLSPETMGVPGEPDADGHSWSWVLGAEASFQLPLGHPRTGPLTILARAADRFAEPIEVTVRIGRTVLGTRPLSSAAEELSFELESAALLHPGRVTVHLQATSPGGPIDAPLGPTDQGAFQIASAGIGPDPHTRSTALPRDARVLAPGSVTLAKLRVAEDTTLHWPLGTDSPGLLWVGLRRLGSDQPLSWNEVALGSEPVDVVPSLEGLVGDSFELSLEWAGAGPLALGEPEYDPGVAGTNVVLIVIDTLRADHTFGRIPGLETPNLARLRSDGIAFDRTFSHAPLTLPSHTALFSSRYPQVSGVTNNWQPVPDDLPLLAEWLSTAGYSSYASVSMGTLWTALPGALLSRGFVEYAAELEMERAQIANKKILPLLEKAAAAQPFLLFAHYSDPHEPYNTGRYPDRLARVELPGQAPFDVPIGTWSRKVYPLELEPGQQRVSVSAERGVYLRLFNARIAGTDEQLEVRFEAGGARQQAPSHVALLDVPGTSACSVELELWIYEALDSTEAPQRYADEVAYTDRAVGRLLARLDELDLYDSSLIVLTSDHGESLLEHDHLGHANHLYDTEIHVPLVIKLPVGHPRSADLARAARKVVQHIDVTPTLLDLLELEHLPGSMGTSLLSTGERRHFAEAHQPEAPEDLYALRDGRYKLIHAPEAGRFELYDVVVDPQELSDLWSERGAEFDEWRVELELLSAGHVAGSAEDMDEETRERLRNLGYLTDE